MEIEYRVRPVTRYVITRHHMESQDGSGACGCETLGEFDNKSQAGFVAAMLAAQEGAKIDPEHAVMKAAKY